MSLISRIYHRFFWLTWESIGFWVLSSLLCILLCLSVVLMPAALGGILYCAARTEQDKDVALRDFWYGFWHFGLRSSILGLILVFLAVLIIADISFYLSSDVMEGVHPMLRIALAGVLGWIGIFGLIILTTAWTFLIYQDEKIPKTLGRGMVLTCTHPFISLNLFMNGILLFLILLLSVVGVPLLLPALASILAVSHVGAVLEYYEERDDRKLRQKIQKQGFQSGSILKELGERESRRRLRYDKGWRDILRPWEMR